MNYYRCADNKWILLTEAQSDRIWHDFCTAMGMQNEENSPSLATAAARREHFAELIAILDRQFATKPRDEWLKIFAPYDFAYAPVYEYADVVNAPQVLENEYILETEHSGMGRVKVVGFPVQFSETPASVQRRPPELGEHTEEVLTTILGYSQEEISKLRKQGALG